MEDAHFVSQDNRFVAVFDGHGGPDVSLFLKEKLFSRLAEALAAIPHRIESESRVKENSDEAEKKDIVLQDEGGLHSFEAEKDRWLVSRINTVYINAANEVIRRVVRELQDEISENGAMVHQGSTLCAALIEEENLWVINVGDSRAVMYSDGSDLLLTKDHKPNDPAERKRIEDAGGEVKWAGWTTDEGEPVPGFGCYRINGLLGEA